jgi:hypothetical protein
VKEEQTEQLETDEEVCTGESTLGFGNTTQDIVRARAEAASFFPLPIAGGGGVLKTTLN